MASAQLSFPARNAEDSAMHDEDEDLTTGEVLSMALVVLVLVPIIWVVEQWRKIRGEEI